MITISVIVVSLIVGWLIFAAISEYPEETIGIAAILLLAIAVGKIIFEII